MGTSRDTSGGFSGIAAVGGAFAGFLSYGGNPDLLAAGIAAGLTFLAALLALHVLHFVFRITVLLVKFAIPAVALLLIGCALDWPVAERAVTWLKAAGHKGVHLAAQGWTELRAR